MPYCIENHCYDYTEGSDPQIFKVINIALELTEDLARAKYFLRTRKPRSL